MLDLNRNLKRMDVRLTTELIVRQNQETAKGYLVKMRESGRALATHFCDSETVDPPLRYSTQLTIFSCAHICLEMDRVLCDLRTHSNLTTPTREMLKLHRADLRLHTSKFAKCVRRPDLTPLRG